MVLARRANDNDDSENAAKYYEMLLLENPSSWEASFYSIYFRAKNCTIANIDSAAYSVANCLNSVFSLVYENTPEEEQLANVKEVSERCIVLARDLLTATIKTFEKRCNENPYEGTSVEHGRLSREYTLEYNRRLNACKYLFDNCAEQIESVFVDNPQIQKQAVVVWKAMIPYAMKFDIVNESYYKHLNSEYLEKIGKYDPTFYSECKREIEEYRRRIDEHQTKNMQSQKNGCYVATAVYGSYDCPQVWTLRRYRDDTLAETW